MLGDRQGSSCLLLEHRKAGYFTVPFDQGRDGSKFFQGPVVQSPNRFGHHRCMIIYEHSVPIGVFFCVPGQMEFLDRAAVEPCQLGLGVEVEIRGADHDVIQVQN